jgi:ABC-type microcin C transport system permease subunit YejB
MTQGRRWLVVTPGLITAMALGFGAAAAADKAKVDQATQQVQQGARQIGQGNVGTGVKETAKGIGNTIVEGAKFSGQTIKEFFAGK